jgi:acyl carrier protein phosphodiesterase
MHEYSLIKSYFVLIYTNGNFLNFLAHQFLSFRVEPIMVGNFIADTVKGSIEHMDSGIGLGIEIHREIDSFTDTHALVLETRKLLYPHFSKYAGVVQDVFYDHYLAKNWAKYNSIKLYDYTQSVYSVLESNSGNMNEQALRILHYMKLQNWLYSYHTMEGIDRALKGLSRRAKFESNMENALPALQENFDIMESHFEDFWPQLQAHILENFADKIELVKK